MKLETADGEEITLEPEQGEGERWRVVSGPEDLEGHGAMRWSDRRLKSGLRSLGGVLARLR